VVQNAALILTMRYVRTRPGEKFFSTTAVVVCETVKMVTCLMIILFQFKGKLCQTTADDVLNLTVKYFSLLT